MAPTYPEQKCSEAEKPFKRFGNLGNRTDLFYGPDLPRTEMFGGRKTIQTVRKFMEPNRFVLWPRRTPNRNVRRPKNHSNSSEIYGTEQICSMAPTYPEQKCSEAEKPFKQFGN